MDFFFTKSSEEKIHLYILFMNKYLVETQKKKKKKIFFMMYSKLHF